MKLYFTITSDDERIKVRAFDVQPMHVKRVTKEDGRIVDIIPKEVRLRGYRPNTPVAVGQVDIRTESGSIWNVHVDENFRRQGIARCCLEMAHKVMLEKGYTSVFLWVNKQNKAAQALYEGLGYNELPLKMLSYSYTYEIPNHRDFKMIKRLK